jgi:hypothetical protein
MRHDGYRVVQFTPPAANVSIVFAAEVTLEQPGSISPITAWELEAPELTWFWWWAT